MHYLPHKSGALPAESAGSMATEDYILTKHFKSGGPTMNAFMAANLPHSHDDNSYY